MSEAKGATMHEIIAAIDDSAAARPVLRVARLVAALFGDALTALYVTDGPEASTATGVAAALDVPLRVRHGEAVEEIAAAATEPGVRAVVVGRRGLPGTRRAVGSTALALIQSLDKPVVVVPPGARTPPDRLRHLLVPLDGSGETATAVQALLGEIAEVRELDVVALHVFEADAIPAFSDETGHEADAWRAEFLRRWLPGDGPAVTLETRIGRAADTVRAVSREVDSDLVALGWKQDLAPGRAQVVATLLNDADVPVLLVPTRVPARAATSPSPG
jgi:nucleotide-binding universal stress UspA family protein